MASRAIFIVLGRILQHKLTQFSTSSREKWVDQGELDKTFESLMGLRADPKFVRYTPFFAAMEDLLTAPLNVVGFETQLVKTLVPIAPYMLKARNIPRTLTPNSDSNI